MQYPSCVGLSTRKQNTGGIMLEICI